MPLEHCVVVLECCLVFVSCILVFVYSRYTYVMKLSPKRIRDLRLWHGAALVTVIAVSGLTLAYGGPTITALFAAATSSVSHDAIAYFSPYDEATSLEVGETAKIDVNINAIIPIDAIGITITYPADALEIVGISKERSFMDLWTEETVIDEEDGEVHFSGGTTKRGGIEGVATAITLNVRAKQAGNAQLAFTEVQVYGIDGTGVPLKSASRAYPLSVTEVPRTLVGAGGSGASASAPPSAPEIPPGPPPPSADFDGNGRVTLLDATVLVFRFIAPYDIRYDIDRNGRIDWGDVNIVFSQMGK